VSVPLYTRMTEADQGRVIRATRSILSRAHRGIVAVREAAGREA